MGKDGADAQTQVFVNLKPDCLSPSIAILSHHNDSPFLPLMPLPFLFPNTLFASVLAHTNIPCLLSLTSCCLTLSSNLLIPRPTFPYYIPYHSHKITHSAAGKNPIITYIMGKRQSFITKVLELEDIRVISFVGYFPFLPVILLSQSYADPGGPPGTFHMLLNICIKDC